MRLRPVLASMFATVIAGACLGGPLVVTAPAQAAEVLVDGGLEANFAPVPNSPTANPSWQTGDSIYGSVLCTLTDEWCDDAILFPENGALPRTGNGWAWFGQNGTPGHTGYLRQTVTIPTIPTGTVRLSYWFRNGAVDPPFDATLKASLDGHVLSTHTEASAPQATYSQVSVDISAYADGAAHLLSFDYLNGAASADGDASRNNMTIDDISIDLLQDTVAPDTAITNGPGAVAKRLSVPVSFTATEAGSTFQCSLDGAPYAACTSPTTVTVKPGGHSYRVAARDTVGNVDATPATIAFKAYDCPTLHHAKAKARHHVSAVKKRLHQAKADGDEQRVEHLQKKLKKAHQRLYHARHAYRPCRT